MKTLTMCLRLQKKVKNLRHGCVCDYDYRCMNCSHIVDARDTLKCVSPEERAKDLETLSAIEEVLPKTPLTTELVECLRALISEKFE